METTRLSSKGQVVLPKSIRDSHHWRAGTEFIVESAGDGVILRPVSVLAPGCLDDVAGRLACAGRPKTVEEMDAAIGDELRDRHDRRRY